MVFVGKGGGGEVIESRTAKTWLCTFYCDGDRTVYILLSRGQDCLHVSVLAPQWGTADVEIKVPSGENTEHKGSPFKAWSRSVYGHTCYTYCQGFLPCLFLPSGPFACIFPKPLPIFFLCWLWLTLFPV